MTPNPCLVCVPKASVPGPVTPVLLSVMEAMAQAERPDMLLVNDMSRNLGHG